MEILIIAPNVPIPPLGSGSIGIYNFAKRWSRDHNVTMVAPVAIHVPQDKIDACAKTMGVKLYAIPILPRPKIQTFFSYPYKIIRRLPTILYYPEITDFLTNFTKTTSFDVVNIEGTGFGGTLYLSAFNNSAIKPQFVLTFYDVLWHWWWREFLVSANPISFIRWLTYRIWEPRFVNQVDCCIFLSPIDAGIVQSIVKPKKMLVVPFGVEASAFPVTNIPQSKEVLFVGSFGHLPNLRAAKWLINEIWPQLKQLVPDAKLTLVGLNPPIDLVNLAKSAGIQLIGDAPDVKPYYQQAQAVVVPIEIGSGIRIKILEAFAAARPVVTTPIGAEGLPVVANEHVLFATSASDIATSLARVLTDTTLAQHLATNGRNLVENEFDWDVLAKRKESAFYSN